jgi:hypothetical protein
MRTPFGQAANFFGRAYADQEEAAYMQDTDDSRFDMSPESDLRIQNPNVGSVPPSLTKRYSGENYVNNYVRGMKESLLETAREKRRPTNGDVALRASGGINTAVKR